MSVAESDRASVRGIRNLQAVVWDGTRLTTITDGPLNAERMEQTSEPVAIPNTLSFLRLLGVPATSRNSQLRSITMQEDRVAKASARRLMHDPSAGY